MPVKGACTVLKKYESEFEFYTHLGVAWHLVMDDMLDAGDVQAPCGHVGC